MNERRREDLNLERARRERIRRMREAKRRQLRRRKLMRLGAMAFVLVLIVVLIGKGIGKLVSGKPGGKVDGSVEVQAQVSEDTSSAGRQPVMSASDLNKMKSVGTLGWQQDDQGWWYRNADGSFYESGWQDIDGKQYYFDDNGYIVTGWQEIDGKDCYFNEDGQYDESVQRPMVALTFDDGPGQYTEELLNCLVENNAKATFFMLGQNVEAYPDVVKKLSDAGMELGNHSYNHPDLPSIGPEGTVEQINKTDEAIKAVTGSTATVMRPTGGAYNESLQSVINYPLILWSVDTKDWATRSEDQTYQVTVDNAQDGSIVLMHDIHEWSVKAAIRAIPELVEKGYKLVTISEMAEAKGIDLQNGKAYYYMGQGEQQVE